MVPRTFAVEIVIVETVIHVCSAPGTYPFTFSRFSKTIDTWATDSHKSLRRRRVLSKTSFGPIVTHNLAFVGQFLQILNDIWNDARFGMVFCQLGGAHIAVHDIKTFFRGLVVQQVVHLPRIFRLLWRLSQLF
jgi:hypothetical protein